MIQYSEINSLHKQNHVFLYSLILFKLYIRKTCQLKLNLLAQS